MTVPRRPATDLDLGRARSIGEIFRDAFWLYTNAPLLFIFLSGIAVVPYAVVVLLLERGHGGPTVGTELILLLVGLALVNPCVSTFQVQALLSFGDGQRPDPRDVIRRAVGVLPVVAAAEIVVAVGVALGFVLFVIPGVLLALRWAVVAQAAAVERTDWPTALRRSGELTRLNYWRILGLLVVVALLDEIPADVTGSGEHLVRAIIGIILDVVVHSFGTLATCVLYFDLRAREATRAQ